MLLGLEPVHIDRQLRGSHDIGKENEFPTVQLGAVAQIQVFCERVVLPTASILDARFSPKPGGAVEVEKTAAPAAGSLLQQQVTIQKHCLDTGQKRVAAIEMSPACLNHAYFRVGEKIDGASEQVGSRDKIGVEYANELAFGRLEADGQSSSFKTGPIDAMD